MRTASISALRKSSKSRNASAAGYCRLILFSLSGSRSQQATNSQRSLVASTRARFGPQYPNPASPTLILMFLHFLHVWRADCLRLDYGGIASARQPNDFCTELPRKAPPSRVLKNLD